MATDKERREIARRMRESRESAWDYRSQLEENGINLFCYDQADYYLIYKAIFNSLPAEHMHPCDYAELHDRLAGLIDPYPERTCNVEKYPPNSELYFETCSVCGCILSAKWPGDRRSRTANYCPNCGNRVVG